MNPFRSAALAAILLVSAPSLAFAHNGLMHSGCPTGQSFTAGDITVTGAYTRAMLPNAPSAGGYLTIANAGTAADTLTGASSIAADQIGVHQMQMNGDVMEMSEVEGGLEIRAGGTVELAPSGYHLMFTGIDTPFEEGQCVEVMLHFANAGDLPIQLNIGGIAQDEPVMDHGPMAVVLGDLEISGAFTRATLPNAPVGAGYLVVTNHGGSDDRLVSAMSPVAGMTQIHEMKMEGDVMKMAELPDGLVIPASGSVTLAPGGFHIMFMELKQALVEGQTIPLTLTFEKAGSIDVQLAVGAINADAPATDHMAMGN
jgi:copper(I)-binding protein